MKLIMSLNPVSQNIFVVVNGEDEIFKTSVYGTEITDTIDTIFKKWYIEAVQVVQSSNNFNRKYVDYIEEKYKNVEVYCND